MRFISCNSKTTEADKLTTEADNFLLPSIPHRIIFNLFGLGEKQKVLHYLKANAYDGTYIVDTAEVNYFIATDKRAEACTTDGLKHRVNYTLEQLMQRLDPIQFFRANRQFIIARKAIHRIQNYGNRQLLVQIKNFDNVQILISKESVATFYDWIEQ